MSKPQFRAYIGTTLSVDDLKHEEAHRLLVKFESYCRGTIVTRTPYRVIMDGFEIELFETATEMDQAAIHCLRNKLQYIVFHNKNLSSILPVIERKPKVPKAKQQIELIEISSDSSSEEDIVYDGSYAVEESEFFRRLETIVADKPNKSSVKKSSPIVDSYGTINAENLEYQIYAKDYTVFDDDNMSISSENSSNYQSCESASPYNGVESVHVDHSLTNFRNGAFQNDESLSVGSHYEENAISNYYTSPASSGNVLDSGGKKFSGKDSEKINVSANDSYILKQRSTPVKKDECSFENLILSKNSLDSELSINETGQNREPMTEKLKVSFMLVPSKIQLSKPHFQFKEDLDTDISENENIEEFESKQSLSVAKIEESRSESSALSKNVSEAESKIPKKKTRRKRRSKSSRSPKLSSESDEAHNKDQCKTVERKVLDPKQVQTNETKPICKKVHSKSPETGKNKGFKIPKLKRKKSTSPIGSSSKKKKTVTVKTEKPKQSSSGYKGPPAQSSNSRHSNQYPQNLHYRHSHYRDYPPDHSVPDSSQPRFIASDNHSTTRIDHNSFHDSPSGSWSEHQQPGHSQITQNHSVFSQSVVPLNESARAVIPDQIGDQSRSRLAAYPIAVGQFNFSRAYHHPLPVVRPPMTNYYYDPNANFQPQFTHPFYPVSNYPQDIQPWRHAPRIPMTPNSPPIPWGYPLQ